MNRREFIVSAGAAAIVPFVPSFLKASPRKQERQYWQANAIGGYAENPEVSALLVRFRPRWDEPVPYRHPYVEGDMVHCDSDAWILWYSDRDRWKPWHNGDVYVLLERLHKSMSVSPFDALHQMLQRTDKLDGWVFPPPDEAVKMYGRSL